VLCIKCGSQSPENVIPTPSCGNTWKCPNCIKEPVLLIDVLKAAYTSGFPGHYLYISEFTNNLDKVNQSFVEGVEFNNPACTITLVLPEGVGHLRREYDAIFVDSGLSSVDDLNEILPLEEWGEIHFVHPTTMEIQ
jgi:hypothetical protein